MLVNRITSTGGDVDLKADGSILAADLSDATDIFGNNITLISVTGGLGDFSTPTVHNDLDIDTSHSSQGVLTISSFASDHIIELSGDLYLYTVSASAAGATAFIDAPMRILNGNPTSNGSNVTSGSTLLFAGGDIGTDTDPLVTTVGFMEGQSVHGSVWINNYGDLELGERQRRGIHRPGPARDYFRQQHDPGQFEPCRGVLRPGRERRFVQRHHHGPVRLHHSGDQRLDRA